jgi:hypothetical protein
MSVSAVTVVAILGLAGKLGLAVAGAAIIVDIFGDDRFRQLTQTALDAADKERDWRGLEPVLARRLKLFADLRAVCVVHHEQATPIAGTAAAPAIRHWWTVHPPPPDFPYHRCAVHPGVRARDFPRVVAAAWDAAGIPVSGRSGDRVLERLAVADEAAEVLLETYSRHFLVHEATAAQVFVDAYRYTRARPPRLLIRTRARLFGPGHLAVTLRKLCLTCGLSGAFCEILHYLLTTRWR